MGDGVPALLVDLDLMPLLQPLLIVDTTHGAPERGDLATADCEPAPSRAAHVRLCLHTFGLAPPLFRRRGS